MEAGPQERLDSDSVKYSAWIFLSIFALIEIVTIFVSTLIGAVCYFIMILVLLFGASQRWPGSDYRFFVALALAPMMRVIGLVLFLNYGDLITQTFLVSIPNYIAIYLVQRRLDLTWQDFGLRFDNWRRMLLIAVFGVLIGGVQYLITRHHIGFPSSLVGVVSWVFVLLEVAFLEEVLFHGVIQRTAVDAMGTLPGIIFVALLLTVFQIPILSPLNLLFVFLVGLVFGWLAYRSGSILAVALAHGLANLMFYLVIPFLWKSYIVQIIAF